MAPTIIAMQDVASGNGDPSNCFKPGWYASPVHGAPQKLYIRTMWELSDNCEQFWNQQKWKDELEYKLLYKEKAYLPDIPLCFYSNISLYMANKIFFEHTKHFYPPLSLIKLI